MQTWNVSSLIAMLDSIAEYLEDHPRYRKWWRTKVVPLQMAVSWLIDGGDPNYQLGWSSKYGTNDSQISSVYVDDIISPFW